jgi:hypothetical protein
MGELLMKRHNRELILPEEMGLVGRGRFISSKGARLQCEDAKGEV